MLTKEKWMEFKRLATLLEVAYLWNMTPEELRALAEYEYSCCKQNE